MVLCFAIRVVVVVEGAIRKPPFSCTGRPITGMQYNNFGDGESEIALLPLILIAIDRQAKNRQREEKGGKKRTERENIALMVMSFE